ncbi:dTMP kinase [Buchnera aphidicola]|jgi:dTMP kinase|uniref:Thymidylate kinase n=1 Tax=Buchnera aphidicola subsp. Schizaphis graminum (strain Sg) TaxID=198804 RepID=KTHY_BUCAP|nr:dTMP kinase [Buchnera aphidicola]Q8K9J3.2 RecName: Full=Thymidylate kinase; AltName: Full=dTMP kinase [Buchnera aphidicola str. Sg (Schizaphis graminum)]AWI49611.1 thymidylate kinase [Buchnera aphidicola (Schizaphis graminum)]
MIKSKFIVIEGLEGAGKTHACICVQRILKENNIKNVILVRQPGSTPVAEKIRKLIKNNTYIEDFEKETELLLMYAARIQLVKKIIQPALKKGTWVISDRHDLSSLAYQGGGLGIKRKLINKLKYLFLQDFIPDLTIYLDVYPEIGLKRASKRNHLDRIEHRSLTFFKKTRASYLKNIKLDKKIIKINANLNIKIVTQNIKNQILKWLQQKVV